MYVLPGQSKQSIFVPDISKDKDASWMDFLAKEGQCPGDSSDMTNWDNAERNVWRGWIKTRRAINFMQTAMQERETGSPCYPEAQ